MSGWSGDRRNHDEMSLSQDPTSSRPPPRRPITPAIRKKQSIGKVKKARQRDTSKLQYTPAHISRIFDTKEAIERVTRNKIVVELEDDNDSDEKVESEEEVLSPLSVASTGSNIAVYRPPTPYPDEVARNLSKATPQVNQENARSQSPPTRPVKSRRKQKLPSVVTISSRETVDIDRLDEVDETPEALQNLFGSPPVDAQQLFEEWSSRGAGRGPSPVKEKFQPLDSISRDAGIAASTTSRDNQEQPTDNTSDLSFATSNGTGLFISDKRRPKKTPVAIAEGTILGGRDSWISSPISSSIPEGDHTVISARGKKAADKTPKNSKKRNATTAAEATDTTPVVSKRRKRSKGSVDVGDLMTGTPRRSRPSRATMKNGEGLLVGVDSGNEAVKGQSLSWQSKGRGKGVTRAKSLNPIAKKNWMGDKK